MIKKITYSAWWYDIILKWSSLPKKYLNNQVLYPLGKSQEYFISRLRYNFMNSMSHQCPHRYGHNGFYHETSFIREWFEEHRKFCEDKAMINQFIYVGLRSLGNDLKITPLFSKIRANRNYEQNSKPNHSWQFIIYIVVGQMGLDHGRQSSLQK